MGQIPNENRRITIKINGEEKSYYENASVHEWKRAQAEVAATNQAKDDDIAWVLPEIDPSKVRKNNIYVSQKSKKKPIKKSVANIKSKSQVGTLLKSIVTALITGTVIAFVMWNVLVKDGVKNPTNEAIPTVGTPKEERRNVANLKRIPTYILQAGVFSQEESAKNHQQMLAEKHLPAGILKTSEDYRVFIGVASSQEEAKKVSETYHSVYDDIYEREIIFPEKEVRNLNRVEKEFLESAINFYETLVIVNNELQLSGEMNDHQQMTDVVNRLKEMKGFQNETIQSLHKSLRNAGESFHQYLNDKKEDDLTEGQHALIKFVELYSQL